MLVSKSFFQRIPFIRISSLFLIGILINHYLPIDSHWVGILLALLIFILIFLWHNSNRWGEKIQDSFIAICLVLSGIFYPHNSSNKHSPNFEKKDYFLAEVCQRPAEKANTYQSVLWIQGSLISKPEKVIAYFSKENFDTTLIAGDQVIILGKLQKIKNRGNPFEFDYKGMMHNKGIDYSVYLSPGTYKKTGIKINRLSYLAEQVREKLIMRLAATNIEKEERSVISALTLGYRAEFDPETLDYFVNTGTIHVLSVSGLHVALIFFILSFLFLGINKGKMGRIIYPSLMILFLWAYAFVTGFSPPVQRSTVMFTFFIIGNILRRPVNTFNSLSASALFLILLDPNVLFDLGFQLSYLAIFGIVLLQPSLESLVNFQNKILKWAWTLLTVSMSAQLITFPLSILYFNQFPNLFWLSNFFVIPGTTLLIWLTFGFFILSPVSTLSNFLAQVIQLVTNWMLLVLKWMSELPYAVTQGIVYTQLQTWVIYALISACVVFGLTKNKKWLFGGLLCFILLQADNLWTKFDLFNQQGIYIYNSKNTIIQLTNGRTNYVVFYGPQSISDQEMVMIQNVCIHLKLNEPQFLDLKTMNGFQTTDIKINGKTINFLNSNIHFSNKLEFNIQGSDLFQFKTHNSKLLHDKKINPTKIGVDSYSKRKQAFYIGFTTQFKEVVVLSLN